VIYTPCWVDPEAWFVPESDEEGIAYAKAECEPCRERAACLAGALERREPFGVFGGLSATEREQILAEQAGAA
jgi:hypothetical protein